MAILSKPELAHSTDLSTSVEVVAQGTEWANLGDSEDEYEETGAQRRRLASEIFLRRESRLLIAAEALKKDTSLGDKDIEIVPQSTEWAGLVDTASEEDDDIPSRACAMEKYLRREMRLVERFNILKKGISLGDTDVEVICQKTEWAGLKGIEEEDNTKDLQVFEIRKRRANRSSLSTRALLMEKPLADREVEVIMQKTEWAAMEINNISDDEDCPNQRLRRHAQDAFQRREQRLSVAKNVLANKRSDASLGTRILNSLAQRLCCA